MHGVSLFVALKALHAFCEFFMDIAINYFGMVCVCIWRF